MPIIIVHEKNKLVYVQDDDFKIAIINMFKELKEDMHKCPNEYCKTQTVRVE